MGSANSVIQKEGSGYTLKFHMPLDKQRKALQDLKAPAFQMWDVVLGLETVALFDLGQRSLQMKIFKEETCLLISWLEAGWK